MNLQLVPSLITHPKTDVLRVKKEELVKPKPRC
jgi:hypothetical protein